MFGKSVPILAILMISMLTIGASAALLSYYGSILQTVTVNQAVLLDGQDYTQPIVSSLEAISGATICTLHNLQNRGAKPANVDWSYEPHIEGIEVLVLKSVHEEYSTAGKSVVATIVKTWECGTAKWVVDIKSDNPAGHTWGVGLVISLDGKHPAFQVFHTGSTSIPPDNTWFYQDYPWTSPLIPLDKVPGITASGYSTGKHFEISIPCERLGGAGAKYYWNMQLRTNLISWVNEPTSGWGDHVTGFIENHNGISIVFPYTLEPGETLDFNLAFNLDINLKPGTYTVTTTFKPAP
jgi:hypothetical protein